MENGERRMEGGEWRIGNDAHLLPLPYEEEHVIEEAIDFRLVTAFALPRPTHEEHVHHLPPIAGLHGWPRIPMLANDVEELLAAAANGANEAEMRRKCELIRS